jgi:hypothetical protein
MEKAMECEDEKGMEDECEDEWVDECDTGTEGEWDGKIN